MSAQLKRGVRRLRIMKVMKAFLLPTLLSFFWTAAALAQNHRPPRFEDYPTSDKFHGKPAPVNLIATTAKITWEINDCGEQSGNPKDGSSINPPLCAQVQGSLPDGRQVFVLILVGTHQAGRKGKPSIWSMSFVNKGAVKFPAKLSELPALLQAPGNPTSGCSGKDCL